MGPEFRDRLRLGERFTFAYIGRLTAPKGVRDLVNAYDLVRRAVGSKNAALVVVGCGPLEPEIRDRFEGNEDCHLIGALSYDRLGAVYAAVDAVVVPSHREAWSFVISEALGFGVPVVANDRVGAADDLCTEENSSRCVAQDYRALADAMLAEYRKGRRCVVPLDPPDAAAAMVNRLRELCARGTRPRSPRSQYTGG